jgi:transposase
MSTLPRFLLFRLPTLAAQLEEDQTMEIMHERVAGLDVHKATIVACVRLGTDRKVTRECRTFDTTTDGLLALLAWLVECRCSHVAMEATGVYWMPVWKILGEGDFALIVANAAHIKNVPGRKSDLNDAMWIADLLACGLIKSSFVPEEDMQELRSLLRTRKQLGREQTRHVQRIQKTLAEANIKLDSVLSDIMGASGRRIIEAMIAGVRDPRRLAALANTRIKATPKQLYDALHGRLTDHHRFLLTLHLRQWDSLDATIREIDHEVEARIARMDEEVKADEAPFRDLIGLVCTIPGVSTLSGTTILSEIGRDMSRFPTAGAPRRLGWPLPRPERERRQAETGAPAQGGALAEDDARPMRLGGQAAEGQLLQSPVLPAASQARTAESNLCRRRLDPHGDLPHPQKRHRTPRPRGRPLQSPFYRRPNQAPGCAAHQTRLRSSTSTHH